MAPKKSGTLKVEYVPIKSVKPAKGNTRIHPPEQITELAKVMAQPDTRKALNDAGVEPSLSTPEALQTYMVSELERWGKVVKSADIKAD